MTQSLLQEPVQSYEDSNGKPLNGGQLFTYDAGTLTLRATYQDSAGAIPNTNPIVLNERGEAVVYGSGNYRMILKNSAGATIWDRDNVPASGAAVDTVLSDLANTTDASKGDAMIGVKQPVTATVARTQHDKNFEVVSAFDFMSQAQRDDVRSGAATLDLTTALQSAITQVVNNGGTLFFPDGKYLTGALTIDARNGGEIIGNKSSTIFLPKAINTTVFNVTNQQLASPAKPFTFDGIAFNGNNFAGGVGIAATDYQALIVQNVRATNIDYLVNVNASSGGSNAFNLHIENIEIYGRASIVITGNGTKRCFSTIIRGINQFTNGGDTWAAPFIKLTRAINTSISDVQTQSLSGTAIGLQIVGQCEGVFVTNSVLVYTASGVVADLSNGDVVLPAWIYFANVGIDQFTVSGFDLQSFYTRLANVNVTGGATRANSGFGLLFRGNCIDYTCVGVQVQGSYHQGLGVLTGATRGRFFGCEFTDNGTSGVGKDIDIVAATPIDPVFDDCRVVTSNLNSSALLNGGSTSRYVTSQRTAVNSAASATNQVLATYTLPAGSFVDGRTLRISASGSFAANGNSKSVLVRCGGANVASMTGTFNNIAWKVEAEVLRVDNNNVWLIGETLAGSTANVTSVVQTPFNSAGALVLELLVTGTAAADIQMHHFDVELIN